MSATSLNVKTWKPATFSVESNGTEAVDQPVWVEAAHETPGEASVLAQEAQRVTDPDPRRDTEELRARHRTGDADEDGESRPARPHALDPGRGHGGIEADLAHDVRRVPRLGGHRGDGRPVVDERVGLGVAGDPDLRKRPAELGESLEQVDRAVERPTRLLRVACHDEDVPDVVSAQPVDDLGDLGRVCHEP